VLFFAAYQLIPRLIDQVALSQYELSDRPAIMFLPTYWFAGAWQQLFAWNGTFKLWTCLALTMVVPFLSIWVVIKYFAPSFNRKLSMITADGHVPATSKSPIKNPASGYSNLLSKLFTKPGIERTSFLFTWKMMLRSRNFKMKVYPSIGYIVVILFIMLIENKNVSFYDITSQTSKGIMHTLMLIYFSNLLLMAALGQISMYEKYKAAWPFFTTPINTPGYIISGSVKAAIAQFFFPFAVVIFVFLTSLAGPMVIPNVLLGIANELLITAVAAYIGISKLPFSSPQQNASGNTLRLFFLMILSVLVAIAHYFVYQILIVVSIFALLSFTATWLVLDAVRRLPWSKVYQSYSED
jgi:hypothetical protein